MSHIVIIQILYYVLWASDAEPQGRKLKNIFNGWEKILSKLKRNINIQVAFHLATEIKVGGDICVTIWCDDHHGIPQSEFLRLGSEKCTYFDFVLFAPEYATTCGKFNSAQLLLEIETEWRQEKIPGAMCLCSWSSGGTSKGNRFHKTFHWKVSAFFILYVNVITHVSLWVNNMMFSAIFWSAINNPKYFIYTHCHFIF